MTRWSAGDAAKQKKKVYNAQYRALNSQSISTAACARRKERRKTDPVFIVSGRIRSLVGNALAGRGYTKKSKTQQVLGCTWLEFVSHIERQFLPGMSWVNRSLWHIDHIVALATAVTEADVIALNHFTNLRPLWIPDNLKKGAKQTHLL